MSCWGTRLIRCPLRPDIVTEPHPLLLPLVEAVFTLGLEPAEDDAFYGEIDGSPALLKLLDADPLAILLGVVVEREAVGEQSVDDLADAFEEMGERATVDVDDGMAWFSFYDLDGWSGDQIGALATHAAEQVRAAGLATGPGCRMCNVEAGQGEEDAVVHYLEGRVARLCPACIRLVVEDRVAAEEHANRAHAGHRLVFPAVVVGCMVAWGVLLYVRLVYASLYPLVDWGLGGVAGGGIGWVAGRNLRGTGLAKMGQVPTAVVATLAVGAGGNLAMFLFALWWNFGVFSFELAFMFLKANFAQFGSDYAFLNLFQAIGFGIGCAIGSERRQVALEL